MAPRPAPPEAEARRPELPRRAERPTPSSYPTRSTGLMLASTTEPAADPALAPPVRLWTPDGFRDDEWTHVDDAGALLGTGRFILPARAVVELDPGLRKSAKGRLGVDLEPGEPLDGIAGLLDDLCLVALAFPAFTDGRSFSKAGLLRGRHAFKGRLRATGQVLIDQLPHMLRLGFDEFASVAPGARRASREGRDRRHSLPLPACRDPGCAARQVLLAADAPLTDFSPAGRPFCPACRPRPAASSPSRSLSLSGSPGSTEKVGSDIRYRVTPAEPI